MEKTHKIEPKQREVLAQMLRDAKLREAELLEASQGISKDRIIRDLATEKGANQLMIEVEGYSEQIKKLKTKSEHAEEDLEHLGFDWDGSHFVIRWDADSLEEQVEDQYRELRKPIEKSLKKYDLAIADIWTVDTNADASKVIEGLI